MSAPFSTTASVVVACVCVAYVALLALVVTTACHKKAQVHADAIGDWYRELNARQDGRS